MGRTVVEVSEAFLERKRRELDVVSAGMGAPGSFAQPGVINLQKRQWAASRRADFHLRFGDATETRTEGPDISAGLFAFSYDYQRANLNALGPSIYPDAIPEELVLTTTLYTNSGMGAIAAALLSLRQLGIDDLAASPGHYAETGELAQVLGVSLTGGAPPDGPFAALLDSAAPTLHTQEVLAERASCVMVDTSCLDASSGRIRSWLQRVMHPQRPILLLRSHTKLDCLGVEYGRLGSLCIVSDRNAQALSIASTLATAAEKNIRLLGAAAIPSHFPPFAGHDSFRELSRRRHAQIIKNTRILAKTLREHGVMYQSYAHGLYLTVEISEVSSAATVSARASAIASKLAARGLPVQHAGSFGFDFVALDWFCDTRNYGVRLRIAPGDIHESDMAEIARCVAVDVAAKLEAGRLPTVLFYSTD